MPDQWDFWSILRKLLNLNPNHLMIIRLLDKQVQNCYQPPQ
jgi:hypothetical protein